MRLLIFCLLLPFICVSQQTINAEQFFSVGLSALEQVEKVDGGKVSFPWIDEYQFRTETSDFDFEEQEYTVRISPSTAKIRNAQKALYEELRNAPDFEGQEIYCDLVLTLHMDWLKLFMLNENKQVMDELVTLLNDKQTVYERMVGTYEFDPQKLLKLQMEKSDLEIELNKIKLEQDYFLSKYNLQNQEIDFENFTTIDAISKYLASANLLIQSESGFLDLETEHEKQLLMKEMELESAEKKKYFDFLQVKYNGPHSDFLEERLSIGLGFQLSNSGNTKLKMQELQIEKEELERKSKRDIQEKQEKKNTLENKLQSAVQVFFHFQKTMEAERVQLQKLSSKIAQKEGTSPLFLLGIEERHLSMKIKALDKKEDLINDYLKYLYQSDKMCQPDFVNYLNL